MTGGESDLHRQDAPVLLLAGPGTGKTYQLALRIRFLTGVKDVPPDQITVISFAAAAAAAGAGSVAELIVQTTQTVMDVAAQIGSTSVEWQDMGEFLKREGSFLQSYETEFTRQLEKASPARGKCVQLRGEVMLINT